MARAAVALGLARSDQHLRLRSLVRRLILLGHVQTSADQGRWSVCPPALVERASEPGAYFLAGGRVPRLLAVLEGSLGKPERTDQPQGDGPACLVYRAAPESVTSLGASISAAGAFAVRLAGVLPDYPCWLASVSTDGSLRTAAFSGCRRFDGTEFVAVACPHQQADRAVGAAGLYEFTPPDGSPLFRYLDDCGAWRAGDYHALRYAGTVAGRGRTAVKALRGDQAVLPLAHRWPLLHERCLVLASGRLPARVSDDKWLRYMGVGRDLLRPLSSKLAFDIEETDDA